MAYVYQVSSTHLMGIVAIVHRTVGRIDLEAAGHLLIHSMEKYNIKQDTPPRIPIGYYSGY